MKMVMAIVHRAETPQVLEALISAGHTATYNESRGGMLRLSRNTLFIKVEDHELEQVLDIIKSNCRSSVSLDSTEADVPHIGPQRSWTEVGGAAVAVWTIEQFEIY